LKNFEKFFDHNYFKAKASLKKYNYKQRMIQFNK